MFLFPNFLLFIFVVLIYLLLPSFLTVLWFLFASYSILDELVIKTFDKRIIVYTFLSYLFICLNVALMVEGPCIIEIVPTFLTIPAIYISLKLQSLFNVSLVPLLYVCIDFIHLFYFTYEISAFFAIYCCGFLLLELSIQYFVSILCLIYSIQRFFILVDCYWQRWQSWVQIFKW